MQISDETSALTKKKKSCCSIFNITNIHPPYTLAIKGRSTPYVYAHYRLSNEPSAIMPQAPVDDQSFPHFPACPSKECSIENEKGIRPPASKLNFVSTLPCCKIPTGSSVIISGKKSGNGYYSGIPPKSGFTVYRLNKPRVDIDLPLPYRHLPYIHRFTILFKSAPSSHVTARQVTPNRILPRSPYKLFQACLTLFTYKFKTKAG